MAILWHHWWAIGYFVPALESHGWCWWKLPELEFTIRHQCGLWWKDPDRLPKRLSKVSCFSIYAKWFLVDTVFFDAMPGGLFGISTSSWRVPKKHEIFFATRFDDEMVFLQGSDRASKAAKGGGGKVDHCKTWIDGLSCIKPYIKPWTKNMIKKWATVVAAKTPLLKRKFLQYTQKEVKMLESSGGSWLDGLSYDKLEGWVAIKNQVRKWIITLMYPIYK